jgi:hypothetical protein
MPTCQDYHVAIDLTYTSDVLNSSVTEQRKRNKHASARESTTHAPVHHYYILESVF